MEARRTTVVGPLTLDRYIDEGVVLPGGGALNVAAHWAGAGREPTLIGRVGAADAGLFMVFAARRGIRLTEDVVADGQSSSIDIRFDDAGQPRMDGFVEGVNAALRLTDAELDTVAAAPCAHLVLVDVVAGELARWHTEGVAADAVLTGDFLDFRHMTTARFRSIARHLRVSFVGWPGSLGDEQVGALVAATIGLETTLVVTFGASGVLVVDGSIASVRWFPVEAREVTGSAVGCGDAFIAAFLDSWCEDGDLAAAVDAGRMLGAAATAWPRPLPDDAYG